MCASRSRASSSVRSKRADDIALDWAELFTDSKALTEGFAGTDVTQRDIERLIAWVKRQLAKPQAAPVDDEGNPELDAEGLPVGPDEDDPAGRVRRRRRSDPACASSS